MTTSTSALLNKPLRHRLVPVLRESGFQHAEARHAWSWRDDCIWVFNLRAVGNYFSSVTGWPPGSICAWLGVFFTFAPRPAGVKVDDHERLRPPEHLCHMRSHLVCGLDQSSQVRHLQNEVERARTDIWWVEPDGQNADDVADDLAQSFVREGLPWYARVSNLQTALQLVEEQRDCFAKFTKAAVLAKHLGDEVRWRKYDAAAEAEARRIGVSLDRNTWQGI